MKKIRLFSYDPPKKGVEKDDERASVQTDFAGFFIMFGRKFWNLSNLNLLTALYLLFVALGVWKLSAIPTAFYVYLGICVLLFGLVCTVVSYITRGYVRGDPVYVVSDAKYAIKHNWKQGIVLGIIDITVLLLLVFDIFFWSGMNLDYLTSLPESTDIATETQLDTNTDDDMNDSDIIDQSNTVPKSDSNGTFIEGVFFYACIFLLIIYMFMRMYIYIIAVTFNLSILKILKNSFIFAFLGIKRNILALLGILLTLFINLYIFVYVPIIGIVLPFIITIGICSFISAYAAYPVIKKYMITPYYKDEEVFESYDKIFEDRG